MLIAQLSDPHITRPGKLLDGRVATARMLAECVARVNKLQPAPDLVLLTGDLVESGHPDEYAQLRTLLAPLRQRVLLLPGNHDARDALRAAFPEQPWQSGSPFLHYRVDLGDFQLIGLDTLRPGSSGGELCDARLAWLDETLVSHPGQPALIAMHHPPFLTGLQAMDDIGLARRDEFAAVVTRHPQVQLIICGHLHRAIHASVAGRRALTCPSPAHQITLDLRPDAALGYMLEPPGFMLHHWQDGGFVTHQVVLGDYPGPYLY